MQQITRLRKEVGNYMEIERQRWKEHDLAPRCDPPQTALLIVGCAC